MGLSHGCNFCVCKFDFKGQFRETFWVSFSWIYSIYFYGVRISKLNDPFRRIRKVIGNFRLFPTVGYCWTHDHLLYNRESQKNLNNFAKT
jgi:hypothetical protein